MSLLTRNGYIVDKENFTESDVRELTVMPKIFYPNDPIRSFEVFKELDDNTVAVPRYWAEKKFGRVERFSGEVCSTSNLIFEGSLRSAVQEEAVQKSIRQLKNVGGGVLSLPTGTGKTVIALYITCILKLKTLIVVHKQFLMDQWTDRISQFVPSARVGRLQQDKIYVEDYDIVVGMLQSIAMREYDTSVFDGFGLVIFDEVHVVPAPVFSRSLFKLCSPYMLGLSATPERRDGLSNVIHWFIGSVFMQHNLEGKTNVNVFAVQVPCNFRYVQGRFAMANILTKLCNNTERNDILIQIISDLAAAKRKVILLSDRRAHCELLQSHIEGSALYLGGMKTKNLKESETSNVLLATYAMAKEGLDIPKLDTLILANPRSDVVQACGRILHGKSKRPVIIDIVDQWCIGKAQFNKRKAYYDKSGFTVRYYSS